MTLSGSGWVSPPMRPTLATRSGSDAAPNDGSVSDSVFDLLDGEPLDALLRDDAADWGDDAALHSALLAGIGATGGESAGVGNSIPSLPPLADEHVSLHPCLDAGHFSPCAMCTPAPAEGEEGAHRLRAVGLISPTEAQWWCSQTSSA